ncbi:hypothetical protein BDZ91DRAFT_719984 [Kalaharituber pfeilii]|nr:hypothetical protein BDZ91DRAFT_719984 [Kalaharituber pfeilii]
MRLKIGQGMSIVMQWSIVVRFGIVGVIWLDMYSNGCSPTLLSVKLFRLRWISQNS